MIPVIPYKGEIFSETRNAYCLQVFGYPILPMKILSFGSCNYSCKYCKRNGNQKENDLIVGVRFVSLQNIYTKIDKYTEQGYVIRLSGGDPCCFPEETEEIVHYVKKRDGIVSIAHNGSMPDFIERVIKQTDFFAIDLKTTNYEFFKYLTDTQEKALEYYTNTFKTIEIIKESKALLDIRTVIFHNTSFEELIAIAQILNNGRSENVFWTWRLYKGNDIQGHTYTLKPPTVELVYKKAVTIKKYFPSLKLGIRTAWDNFSKQPFLFI